MYDDNESPYRCPICLVRPSLCTVDATTKLQTVGCMTYGCSAPIFTQKANESKYVPLIEWDKWVVRYRNNHDWHRNAICKGCLKYRENHICSDYDENCINCPNAEYPTEN